MFEDLFIACAMLLAGIAFFGHFETYTHPARKVVKWTFTLGIVALLSNAVGHWSLLFMLGLMLLGLTFHFWWCGKHGIHPLTAEPRAKYFALRGWKLPA